MIDCFQHESPRHGVAFLIVLLMLVLVVPLCAATARSALTHRRYSDQHAAALYADDLRHEADRLILAWLAEEAGSVVLPPETAVPLLTVIDDELTTDAHVVRIQITAFDQDGMVPLPMMQNASPLRLTVPTRVTRELDNIDTSSLAAPVGLDQFSPKGDIVETSPFPTIDADQEDAIGAHVSTHPACTPRLNVNTTPIDRVEAAFRMLGRGGVELIEQARADGELATVATLPASPDTRLTADHKIELATQSQCWSFRVDITVDRLRRSWWVVYRAGESSNSNWECVQRLDISL